MMKGKLFLDIHALQVVPPSCLNRMTQVRLKTAIFGGFREREYLRRAEACYQNRL